jgi:hypothetical protein
MIDSASSKSAENVQTSTNATKVTVKKIETPL